MFFRLPQEKDPRLYREALAQGMRQLLDSLPAEKAKIFQISLMDALSLAEKTGIDFSVNTLGGSRGIIYLRAEKLLLEDEYNKGSKSHFISLVERASQAFFDSIEGFGLCITLYFDL